MKNLSIYDQVINFNENEESEVIVMVPYLKEEFKKWLMETREINDKSAEDYLRSYESAYESLYELVGMDLYEMLRAFLSENHSNIEKDIVRDVAPELVNVYLDTLQKELDKHEDAYSKANFLAMVAYHDFIVEVAGSTDQKLLKRKSKPLPDEEDFKLWLENEYKFNLDDVTKIVSSVRRMDMILPSMVSEPMSFLDVVRALPDKCKRESYLTLVSKRKGFVYAKADCSIKTINNGLSNIGYYIKFLSR